MIQFNEGRASHRVYGRFPIRWSQFPGWPGVCWRCGGPVIFKPMGKALNKWGVVRRWRMKNVGGGSHSKSCPVKQVVGRRIRGPLYLEPCGGCQRAPWEVCPCSSLLEFAGQTAENVPGVDNGSLYPAKGSAPSPSPEIANRTTGTALRG